MVVFFNRISGLSFYSMLGIFLIFSNFGLSFQQVNIPKVSPLSRAIEAADCIRTRRVIAESIFK